MVGESMKINGDRGNRLSMSYTNGGRKPIIIKGVFKPTIPPIRAHRIPLCLSVPYKIPKIIKNTGPISTVKKTRKNSSLNFRFFRTQVYY
jgi:hypothetical protein